MDVQKWCLVPFLTTVPMGSSFEVSLEPKFNFTSVRSVPSSFADAITSFEHLLDPSLSHKDLLLNYIYDINRASA